MNIEGKFGDMLVLVDGVVGKYRSVPGHHMDGILHLHLRETEVRRIRHQPIDRANQPFRRVEYMTQNVLNHPASTFPAGIICRSIVGAPRRKVGASPTYNLHGESDAAGVQLRTNCLAKQDGSGKRSPP